MNNPMCCPNASPRPVTYEDPAPSKAWAAVCRVMRGDGMKHGARTYVDKCKTEPGRAVYIAKAQKHLYTYKRGIAQDADSGESPLVHAIARLMCIVEADAEGQV